MQYTKTVTIAPAAPNDRPVTVESARKQCRIPDESEDVYLGGLIDAATNYVERVARLVLCPQTIRVEFECFPRGDAFLVLPYSPVRGTVTLEYAYPETAVWTALADFQTWATERPVLAPAAGEIWPLTEPLTVPAVRATYATGFASVAAIPPALRSAVLMIVRLMYENPDGWNRGEVKMPLVISQLIGVESRRGYP